MASVKLSDRELGICQRLREARDLVGVSQEKAADLVGVQRTTVSAYEYKRAPVRCEFALRFCRRLIISEEWLATGRFDATIAAGLAKGFKDAANKVLAPVYKRLCMSLISTPEARNVPISSTFSEAYDALLGDAYRAIIQTSYGSPRVFPEPGEGPEFMRNLCGVFIDKWLASLDELARVKGLPIEPEQRQFVADLLRAGEFIFKRHVPLPVPAPSWLVALVNDPNLSLGLLSGSPMGNKGEDFKVDIDAEIGNDAAVTSESKSRRFDELRQRIKSLCSERGAQRRLADSLEASPAQVSRWLAGSPIPNGEVVLQMIEWADSEQQKNKGARGPLERPSGVEPEMTNSNESISDPEGSSRKPR